MANRNAFGHIANEYDASVDLSKSILDQYTVEVDTATGDSKPVVTGQVDLDALVQTYKDQCGMVAAMNMIKSGMVGPDAFADDGKHGVDCSFPTDINTAAALAAMSDEEAQALASKLGIKNYTDEDIDKIVEERIKAILSTASATSTKEGEV